MKPNKAAKRSKAELDTLAFHREMYERRLRKMKQRQGLTHKEIVDEANDPAYFRRQSAPQPLHASHDGL